MKEDVEVEAKASLDPVEGSIGGLGRWQIWVCGLIFLLKFPSAWHQLSISFLAPKPEFFCIDQTLSQCDADCPEHVFNTSVFTNTIQMEWDLVCSRQSLSNWSQTIFMFGILVGSLIFGVFADKVGRRMPLVVAVILQLLSGVATSFSPNYWVFVVLRFISAVATGGTLVVSFVLVMEIIGSKWRELVSVLYQIPFNLGHLTLPLFSFYLRDWRYFQFALSIVSVLLISYYWLLPESPRWLFTVGRVDESVKVLEKAAKFNKLPTENIRGKLESVHGAKTEQKPTGNALDLIRTRNMRVKTVCMHFNWFVSGVCFFGVSQYIGEIGGNIFKNVALAALFELPGTLSCIPLVKYLGRKKTLILGNCLCGFAMLAIAFINPDRTGINTTLATVALTGTCISFPTVYLYAGELFPTVIRNVGIGTASMVARIGSMIAPFIASGLSDRVYWLPPIIFGVTSMLGAFLVLFLPETRGCTLPETIEDAINFGKHGNKKNETS